MKIVQLYNEQRSAFGGESTAIANTTDVLKAHGHEVSLAMRSSRGIEGNPLKKVQAALSGIYSFSAVSEIKELVARERPDVIHAHGIYPLWSPSIFHACRRLGVPTVLHVHCHYLTCPNWYHLRNGQVCNLCFGGKEQWCILTNCRSSHAESVAYALRSAVARKLRLLTKNVGVFLSVSQFLNDRLVAAGYPAERIQILRNVVPDKVIGSRRGSETGIYIGYCGRLSQEKGVHILIEAARRSGLPVQIAGDGPAREPLERSAPPNVQFIGFLQHDALARFYENCRFLVVPSLSLETFSLAAAECMMHGRPVIGSRIGAIPEVVAEGKTGLLFEPGNAAELATLMSGLWSNVGTCDQYGRAAREKATNDYCEQVYYSRLIAAYEDAADFAGTMAARQSPVSAETV